MSLRDELRLVMSEHHSGSQTEAFTILDALFGYIKGELDNVESPIFIALSDAVLDIETWEDWWKRRGSTHDRTTALVNEVLKALMTEEQSDD